MAKYVVKSSSLHEPARDDIGEAVRRLGIISGKRLSLA